MRVAVLTISDSVTKGEREDLSGPAVVAFCRGLGWEITSMLHVSDDPASIREQLRTVADSGRVDVLLTTGGTGIGPRDNTPEATQAVADRIVQGAGENADGRTFPRNCCRANEDADRQSARKSQGCRGVPRSHSASAPARRESSTRGAARLSRPNSASTESKAIENATILDGRAAAPVSCYPPAMAPMIRSGSAPDATASGSGVSGGSRE